MNFITRVTKVFSAIFTGACAYLTDHIPTIITGKHLISFFILSATLT
ncbi:MAG: hypothetical protein BAJALOKI3v1_1010004 [Promethearchaeota archaeon]|nr:MAG: hypothetical protein BAJALOKI3v1_1010004 [Candidatus Lokiarchaeota archaeon]